MIDNVEIKFFTEYKKVIPLLYKIGNFWVTNIKLPDIFINNKSKDKIKLTQITILGYNSKKEIINFIIYEEEIKRTIENVIPQINAHIKEQNPFNSLKLTFGKTLFEKNHFSNKNILEPQEITMIPLSLMLFFHYIGSGTIDNLQVNFFINSESEQKVIEFPIDLFFVKATEDYIFPLKGNLCICNLPMNLSQHRKAQFQEFAFDIVGIEHYQGNEFSTSYKANPKELIDYSIFRRNVMAIGDGKVIEVGNKFPESKMNNTQTYSEEFFTKLSKQLLPKIGLKNTIAGNYIIIEHCSEQFSFYAHLSENSICVKEGDKVKQGDVIAKVGNTGHSTEPHLHFQLIDSKNLFEANCLPIMFKNIPINEMNQNFTESNSLICSDFFYIHIQ